MDPLSRSAAVSATPSASRAGEAVRRAPGSPRPAAARTVALPGVRVFRPDDVFSAAALTREQRVVVRCARALAGTGAEPPLASLLDADPALLVPLAWRHGVLPYLSRRVASAGEAAAHPSFAPLRAAFLENGVRALQLTGELAGVAATLEAAGVVPLAYKGPALALQAFGDASLRDYGDLDLVVRRGELAAAGEALERAGFREVGPAGGRRAALLRSGHHLAYRRGEVLVEVHWRFGKALYGFTEELSGVWARAETLDVRGRRVRALSVADHLLALAIHSSKGMWASLDATVCMVRLARRIPAAAWPAVAARARRWRCDEALRVSLLLGERMLGCAYPRELAAVLPPTARARRLAARVAAELFVEGFGGRSFVRGQLALRRGWRERLGFALRMLRHAGTGEAGWEVPLGLRDLLARPLRVLRRYWN